MLHSDQELDLAIRASRHDITYWAEQDVESCLLDSIAMTMAEEKKSKYLLLCCKRKVKMDTVRVVFLVVPVS